MNTLPEIHPRSRELIETDKVLASVALSTIIDNAASELGFTEIPTEQTRHMHDQYIAHNTSDVRPHLYSSSQSAYIGTDEASAITSTGDRITAHSHRHSVAGNYPLLIEKRVNLEEDGKYAGTIIITEARHGEYFRPVAKITDKEGARILSAEEMKTYKRKITEAFGLDYVIGGSPLFQRQDALFFVEPEIRESVDKIVIEMSLNGFSGKKLRQEVLRRLHPDSQSLDVDSEAMFKYASSLDFEQPVSISLSLKDRK